MTLLFSENAGADPQDPTISNEILKDRAVLFLNGEISEHHLGVCSMLLEYHYKTDFNEPVTFGNIYSGGGVRGFHLQIYQEMPKVSIKKAWKTVCKYFYLFS